MQTATAPLAQVYCLNCNLKTPAGVEKCVHCGKRKDFNERWKHPDTHPCGNKEVIPQSLAFRA